MSIEFSGSDSLPRLERSEAIESGQVQQQGTNELNQSTIDNVREIIREQRADNAEQRELSQEQLQQVAEEFVEVAQTLNRHLQFSVHDDIDHTVITVVDRNTGETVRQIPSEEVVRLAQRISELSSNGNEMTIDSATGLLIDSRV